MPRTLILAIGAILWATLGAVVAFHVVIGDWLPLPIAALVGATWVTVRRARLGLAEAT